ncbi:MULTISPECIES: hypothetical protein [Nocardioides]|uniref:Uncharacterized protein n=1 Tax=Nocardioides vastitatis TaxID=2568655 RepID=A0ABW0ZAW2_9ACTN|nr:hypothetical protein [Nocardioides sp.]THI96172.1 hypothetical protein E7Z54_17440 [Nocardioides sp.]
MADGREVAAWIGAIGLCCVLVSPGFRVPRGVPVALTGLVAAYEAALVGRFDEAQWAILLGTGLMAILAISVLGFNDEADRRRTWGEPRRVLPVEPGPLVGWPNLRSRRRRHLVDAGGFVAVGLLCAAYGLHQGDA